jgi:mRNA deadenylase 3'-5' endonuclease subunit Ccr4
MASAAITCSHFLRGTCAFGAQCRFSHVVAQQRPAARASAMAARTWQATKAAIPPTFSVVSYNVLCDAFVWDPPVYPYCPDWALDADYRAAKAVDMLRDVNADILCLQEVDAFAEFWVPKLRQLGYEGLYKKRTGDKPDGVATFYRTSRFAFIQSETIEYSTIPQAEAKDNVGLLLLLQPLTPALASAELPVGAPPAAATSGSPPFAASPGVPPYAVSASFAPPHD